MNKHVKLHKIKNQEIIEILMTILAETRKKIKTNFNTNKAPEFDLIREQIRRELPRKAWVKLKKLINAPFRLKHVS